MDRPPVVSLEPAPARDETLWSALVLVLFGLLAWFSRLPWVFAGGPLLIFIGTLARTRLGYYLAPSGLVVRTLVGSRVIPRERLRRVEYLELGGGFRLLATYFPGYAVGFFYLSGLGRQHLIASTDRGEAIRVHLEPGGSFIMTPRDTLEALAAFDRLGIPVEGPRWVLRELRRRRSRGSS